MSVEELAAQTKLARATLEALETDDFEHLMESVYVRGYYRKCAKILGIPAAEVLDAYHRVAPEEGPHRIVKLLLPADGGGEFSASRKRRGGIWWLVLLVIIVLALAAWYAQRYRSVHEVSVGSVIPSEAHASKTRRTLVVVGHSAASGTAPPAVRGDAFEATNPKAAATVGKELPSATKMVTGGAQVSTASAASVAGAAGVTADAGGTEVATAVAPAATQQLVLDFTGRSWVQITDSTGTRLLTGIFAAGQHQVLDGTPPYEVALGNADAVQVHYQGQLLAIAPFIQSNSTARFHVPLSP